MKKKILALINATGDHPSFTLPPVSLFLSRLRKILEEPEIKVEETLLEKYGPYEKDDSRAKRGF